MVGNHRGMDQAWSQNNRKTLIRYNPPDQYQGNILATGEFIRKNLRRPLTIPSTSSVLSATTIPGSSVYYSAKSMIVSKCPNSWDSYLSDQNRLTEFIHIEYQGDGVSIFAYHSGTSPSFAWMVISSANVLHRSGWYRYTRFSAKIRTWHFFRITRTWGWFRSLVDHPEGRQDGFLRGKVTFANWVSRNYHLFSFLVHDKRLSVRMRMTS